MVDTSYYSSFTNFIVRKQSKILKGQFMKKIPFIFALFLLSISGLLLHLRIHPFLLPNPLIPEEKYFDFTHSLATFFPLVDVIFVTILFYFRKTCVYGYLINGIIVIYGTILMGHLSINQMIIKNIPLEEMILKSTLPDIGIAWADFFVGKALFDLYMKGEVV